MELEKHAGLSASPATAPAPRRVGPSSWVMAGVVALVLAGGGWFAATNSSRPAAPHVGISTTTGLGAPYGGRTFVASDSQLTDKQWQERADGFRQFAAKGAVQLDRLTQSAALDYLGKAGLEPTQQSRLQQGVQQDKIEMVALGFYDDCAEDGDVVRVQAGGIDVTVSLLHQVQYVEIPVPKGQAVQVTVLGTKDGTGGITLGMVTPSGDIHMPRLQPGEQVGFQAR